MARRPIILPLGTPNDGSFTLSAIPDTWESARPKIEANLHELSEALLVTRRVSILSPRGTPFGTSVATRAERPDRFEDAVVKIDECFTDLAAPQSLSFRQLIRPIGVPTDGSASVNAVPDTWVQAAPKIEANLITLFTVSEPMVRDIVDTAGAQQYVFTQSCLLHSIERSSGGTVDVSLVDGLKNSGNLIRNANVVLTSGQKITYSPPLTFTSGLRALMNSGSGGALLWEVS